MKQEAPNLAAGVALLLFLSTIALWADIFIGGILP